MGKMDSAQNANTPSKKRTLAQNDSPTESRPVKIRVESEHFTSKRDATVHLKGAGYNLLTEFKEKSKKHSSELDKICKPTLEASSVRFTGESLRLHCQHETHRAALLAIAEMCGKPVTA